MHNNTKSRLNDFSTVVLLTLFTTDNNWLRLAAIHDVLV